MESRVQNAQIQYARRRRPPGVGADLGGVTFEDRGEHELTGIEEPQRLYEARWHK